MKVLSCALLVALSLLGVMAQEPTENIVEVAQRLGATTLVDLAVRAGLAPVLTGPGPLTVFGPTNDAFAALGQDVLDELLNNTQLLTDVLTYHVAAGRVLAGDITNEQLVPSVQGTNIRLNLYDNIVTATGSQVALPDQLATNGVVHVVNKVMYPIPSGTVVDAAVGNPAFSTLVTALTRADLVATLQGEGPFTVFAPTDAAFAKIPSDELDRILNDVELLRSILLYHVVPATAFSVGLKDGDSFQTVTGQTVAIGVSEAGVTVNGAAVNIADIAVTNGVIHAIDTVLMPPTAAKSLEERVFDDIEKMWEIFPKNYVEDAVTYFDVNDFFSKYDKDGGEDFSVDEDEFAAGFSADIGCSEIEARAFFKKFDFTRYDVEFIPFEEVIDESDTVYIMSYLDLNLDLALERNEFELGFGFTASDLPWGVMFMNYRSVVSTPTYYDDHLSFNNTEPEDAAVGDWQRLFDDMDTDNDGFLVVEEFEEFYVGKGYGIAETAQRWFDASNLLDDGFIDRTFEWTFVFTNLNEDIITDQLSFDEFVFLDFYVRPVNFASSRSAYFARDVKNQVHRYMKMMKLRQ